MVSAQGDPPMRSGLLSSAVLAVTVFAAPAMALQSVTLPQPPVGTTNYQNPDSAFPDQFSSGQSDDKTNSLGSFHFNVTSGSDWPGDPYRFNRPQNSTPDAYGNASTPGSEFSTSNTFYPH
jgi:hypothetical protein